MGEIEELKTIYYESGIWRKYNWYDFLEKLLEIKKQIDANKY